MRIILVASQKQHGKDTTANYLADELNKRVWEKYGVNNGLAWKREAFAYALKRIYCETFGVDNEFIEKYKTLPDIPEGMLKTCRESMQFIGDGFRTIMPTVWIDIVFRQPGRLCISDGRYLNEARRAKKEKGKVILVYRPGYLNDDVSLGEAELKPYIQWCIATNQEGQINYNVGQEMYDKYGITRENMENFDIFLVNDGTIPDLHKKIDDLLDYFD